MSTVKYKNDKYTVSFSDKIKIDRIKILLVIKRVKRWIWRLIPQNVGLYIILTIIWIIFGIITYFWGIAYSSPESYTLADVAWDLRNPVFTSIILAIVIVGYS